MIKIPNPQAGLRRLSLAFLLLCSQPLFSKTLSSQYLSPQDQLKYQAYFQLVERQRETGEDLLIERRYSVLVNQFAQSADKMIRFVQYHQGWGDIFFMLKGTEACEDSNAFRWGSGKVCEWMGVDWVAPILHHQGDLTIEQSVELDMPLLVEGNLTIKGNLILKRENTPLVVTGDIRANHLLYGLMMTNQGPHLFVKGKTLLTGYAFMEGATITFDPRLSCKATYALGLVVLPSSRSTSKSKLFPDTPGRLCPGILQYSDFYQRNEFSLEALEQCLLEDRPVFQ